MVSHISAAIHLWVVLQGFDYHSVGACVEGDKECGRDSRLIIPIRSGNPSICGKRQPLGAVLVISGSCLGTRHLKHIVLTMENNVSAIQHHTAGYREPLVNQLYSLWLRQGTIFASV